MHWIKGGQVEVGVPGDKVLDELIRPGDMVRIRSVLHRIEEMRVGPEIHYDAFQAVVAFIAHDPIGERVWQRIASVINLIRPGDKGRCEAVRWSRGRALEMIDNLIRESAAGWYVGHEAVHNSIQPVALCNGVGGDLIGQCRRHKASNIGRDRWRFRLGRDFPNFPYGPPNDYPQA